MSAVRTIFDRAAEVRSPNRPTPRPFGVRIANLSDEGQIYDLLVLMAEEIALLPISETKVRAMIRHAAARNGGVIGIVENEEKIVGAVCLVMNQGWYSESWFCDEIWNFVHPDHRRGLGNDYAKRLLQFSKWWSEQLGMPLVMGIMSTKRTMGKIRFYMRNLRLIGGIFLWRPGDV